MFQSVNRLPCAFPLFRVILPVAFSPTPHGTVIASINSMTSPSLDALTAATRSSHVLTWTGAGVSASASITWTHKMDTISIETMVIFFHFCMIFLIFPLLFMIFSFFLVSFRIKAAFFIVTSWKKSCIGLVVQSLPVIDIQLSICYNICSLLSNALNEHLNTRGIHFDHQWIPLSSWISCSVRQLSFDIQLTICYYLYVMVMNNVWCHPNIKHIFYQSCKEKIIQYDESGN